LTRHNQSGLCQQIPAFSVSYRPSLTDAAQIGQHVSGGWNSKGIATIAPPWSAVGPRLRSFEKISNLAARFIDSGLFESISEAMAYVFLSDPSVFVSTASVYRADSGRNVAEARIPFKTDGIRSLMPGVRPPRRKLQQIKHFRGVVLVKTANSSTDIHRSDAVVGTVFDFIHRSRWIAFSVESSSRSSPAM